MGKHKEENEDLIKYGQPQDIWFHVDKFSSAHVYLRLPEGQTIDQIPPAVLEDCCQLVKANSIEGTKVNSVTIVYTPWSNLKKTGDMEVGQVGFYNTKLVKKEKVEKKKNDIVNRLDKTKREEFPDLAEQKAEREKQEREKKKAIIKNQLQKEKQEIEKKQKESELRSYSSIMVAENMATTNADMKKSAVEYEEDFM